MPDQRRSQDHALDQISLAIGGLQSDMRTAERDRNEIRQDVKNILVMVQPLKDLPERVDVIEARAASFERIKQRGIGMGLILTALGGSVVEVVHWVADKVGGTPHGP